MLFVNAPKTYSVKARRACCDDIGFLVEQCRLSLEDKRFQQGPSFRAGRIWREVLESDFSEVWVFLNDQDRIGFCRLVLNDAAYMDYRRGSRRTFLEVVCTFLRYPFLSVKKGMRWFWKDYLIAYNQGYLQGKAGPYLWINPVIIVPSMRGMGYGCKLLEFIICRTSAVGFCGVKLQVTKDNAGAIRLYEKFGFVKIFESRHIFTYALLLSDC